MTQYAPRSAEAASAVRTRRAYFDCRFGQLHVRTAFPTTGGFDEQVTLFCLHSTEGSSRTFERFLPAVATDRSVYAPDLPGCGESDPAPTRSPQDFAAAVADLARNLRLRQIDLLGFRRGAAVALELAATQPELIRRVVWVGLAPAERLALVNQRAMGAPTQARFVDLPDDAEDPFAASPAAVAQKINAILNEKP